MPLVRRIEGSAAGGAGAGVAVQTEPARLGDLLLSVQEIPLARLIHVLCDLFGLDISEGAGGRQPEAFRGADEPDQGAALASDETGMRVGKANWWLWVFHHADSAIFVADKHRSKAGPPGHAHPYQSGQVTLHYFVNPESDP
jgi:hypothetical protein